MIARLTGTVADVRALQIVLDVGGVGYLLSVRNPSDFKIKDSVSLHTHLAVRENAMDLYGFHTTDELEMFEHLLRLPKIGPRSAMQILSQADVNLLKESIANEDPSYLSKMSGIGTKSAEKIVSGLKNIFADEALLGKTAKEGDAGDVIDALLALGYTQRDALNAIQKIPSDITDTREKIKEALKQIG